MWGCGRQLVWLLCCSSYSVPAASRYFCGMEWEQEQQGKNSNMEAREWIHSSHFLFFSLRLVQTVCLRGHGPYIILESIWFSTYSPPFCRAVE